MINTLYPELLDYIFDYCSKYFLENETKARWHLMALSKSKYDTNSPMFKWHEQRNMTSTDKNVLALIENGFEAFKIKVATRIFNEHKHELELNLCPKCNKIARTPKAKQCRFCSHDWH